MDTADHGHPEAVDGIATKHLVEEVERVLEGILNILHKSRQLFGRQASLDKLLPVHKRPDEWRADAPVVYASRESHPCVHSRKEFC